MWQCIMLLRGQPKHISKLLAVISGDETMTFNYNRSLEN